MQPEKRSSVGHRSEQRAPFGMHFSLQRCRPPAGVRELLSVAVVEARKSDHDAAAP